MSITNGEAVLILPDHPRNLPETFFQQRQIVGRTCLGGPVIGRGPLVGVIINNESITAIHGSYSLPSVHISEASPIVNDPTNLDELE